MRKCIFILLILSACSFAAFSQSAEKVAEMVKSENVTIGQAAYFSATALGLVKDDESEENSMAALKDVGGLSDSADAGEFVTAKKVAEICSKTWVIKGSLMYSLLGTPRYAFRQMKADGVFPSSMDPDKKLSGREFLSIITDCIELYELKNDGGAE